MPKRRALIPYRTESRRRIDPTTTHTQPSDHRKRQYEEEIGHSRRTDSRRRRGPTTTYTSRFSFHSRQIKRCSAGVVKKIHSGSALQQETRRCDMPLLRRDHQYGPRRLSGYSQSGPSLAAPQWLLVESPHCLRGQLSIDTYFSAFTLKQPNHTFLGLSLLV